VAPVDLVEEVLDLHSTYLSGPALDVREDDAQVEAGETRATTPAETARAAPRTRPEDAPQGS
jgi:hypothetical protein